MDEKTLARFWSKVEKTESCWLWTASRNTRGYGQLRISGANVTAHRLSWTIAHGRTPEQCVLHRCDVRTCVNPAHLFEGSNRDNVNDRVRKQRSARVLNKEQAIEAMRRVAQGESYRSIGAALGVSTGAIFRLAKGQTWRWLHEEISAVAASRREK